jgi:hypothetical protein
MFERNRMRIIFMLAVVVPGLPAFAHEGHGHTAGQGHTAAHYLTEPLHWLQFVALALVVFVIGWVTMKWYFSSNRSRFDQPTLPR